MKIRVANSIIEVLLVGALLTACVDSPATVFTATTTASPPEFAPPSLPSPIPLPTPTAVPATVKLLAVGDIMLGRSIGAGLLTGTTEPVFDDPILAFLLAGDVTVGNLESPVSERGEPARKSYTFRAPPIAVETLAAAGFDVVSLANNHALDYGPPALADTERLLRDALIQPVGSGANIVAARAPAIVERGGLQIAFVALVDAPSEGAGFSRETWEAQQDRPGVAWADVETVASTVSQAARAADLVVVLLHFGSEFQSSPSAAQRTLARAAIDAGATLVVGSHPHVVQEVEEYHGGLIAYSLGNFVFDGFAGLVEESAILAVDLAPTGIGVWRLVPVRIESSGRPHLSDP